MVTQFFIDGSPVLIDDVDSDLISLPWRFNPDGYVFVSRAALMVFNPAEPVLRSVTGSRVYLHQTVLHRHAPVRSPEALTDHANRLRYDNTRTNLRWASWAFNNANSTRNNHSGYRGVYLQKTSGKYISSISVRGKNKHLGLYESAETAALVYNTAASVLFGEFATLNPI